MTDDIEKLIAEARKYGPESMSSQLIRKLADALEAEHQRRIEAEEVLAGADHTAAKYWRRMKGAEFARNRLADDLVKTGEDADRYMAERDALRAAIQETRSILVAGSIPPGMTEAEFFKWLVADAFRHLSRAIDTEEKP